MISVNCIEDSEYNAVNHVEKQNNDVINMKQETLKDVHTSNMAPSIEKIKE